MRKGMRKAASFSRLSSAGRHERSSTRPPILARLLSCTLVLGCAALLGLPTSASAGTILVFGQTDNINFVQAAFSGDTATLTTVGVTPTTSISIPVVITQIGSVPISPAAAFETFVGLTSSTPQTGDLKGGFSGEIIIFQFSAENGYGEIALATTFSGGTLKADGSSGSLAASVPLNTVTFTTQNPSVEAALGGTLAWVPSPLIRRHHPATGRSLRWFHDAELRCFLHHVFITTHHNSRARLHGDGGLGRAALCRAGHARLQAASAQVQVI